MSPVEELESKIAALGRPERVLLPFNALVASLEAAKQWDLAHPEQAAEYHALCAELNLAIREAEARELEAKNAERVLRLSAVRLERSGVGERSLVAARSPTETMALRVVQQWLAGDAPWLVLCGSKGTGKTVAATWAVAEVIRRGDTAAFRRASEIARLSSFEVGAAELGSLARVGLFALDELGAENLTDHARGQLHELLDRRHESPRLRTVVTTNLRASALAERIGERLVDRIKQGGGFREISGASLREKAGAA